MTHSRKRLHLIGLIWILLATTIACAGSAPSTQATSIPAASYAPDSPVDWYQVYFTAPEEATSKNLRGGPDSVLAKHIRTARASVDIAAHQLDLWSIRDALIYAHRQGVSVRMVTESDYLDEPEVQEIIAAGIPVLGDRREGLMHNKFVIIDRMDVWTGSMNLTINGAYRNNNNLIHIRSSQLAEDYTNEFEEMFIEDLFGSGSPANTPHPTLDIEGTLIEVYFSPDDGVSGRLVELIDNAQESIYFLAFSFTSDPLSDAIIRKAQSDVQVMGVFERSQYRSNAGTEYDRMKAAGLAVKLDGNRNNMHHKVIIIDKETVVTGSYNFSKSAEIRNDENILIIHNPELASYYLTEFKKVYQQAQE
jgi:phosphatidylserine/phosphatidylglycerophosphate/cardiolipin synthase-like enzyme